MYRQLGSVSLSAFTRVLSVHFQFVCATSATRSLMFLPVLHAIHALTVNTYFPLRVMFQHLT